MKSRSTYLMVDSNTSSRLTFYDLDTYLLTPGLASIAPLPVATSGAPFQQPTRQLSSSGFSLLPTYVSLAAQLSV